MRPEPATRREMRGPWSSTLLALVSINFVIDSDSKWLLLGFALPWVAAIGLSGAGK